MALGDVSGRGRVGARRLEGKADVGFGGGGARNVLLHALNTLSPPPPQITDAGLHETKRFLPIMTASLVFIYFLLIKLLYRLGG